METNSRTIEVDVATADALEARAAERGLSVSELVAELVTATEHHAAADTSELDRRWADYVRTGESYDLAEVEAWLRTVGTPAYRPFDEFRAGVKRS
jgi:hypothetical protein